ncbi:hypothetical protein PENTCL1PPCAC_19006 [Pristionchus entomophagus]|uniref:Uncharacterized protein n=1 Tax=Pristionchus entomophagus TaxID=358040 RepID=A0AAV5TRH2_9BILA|nr:hypothetical protein PENTCL1PPCAC_19006 [Pristionchus entomophagus]
MAPLPLISHFSRKGLMQDSMGMTGAVIGMSSWWETSWSWGLTSRSQNFQMTGYTYFFSSSVSASSSSSSHSSLCSSRRDLSSFMTWKSQSDMRSGNWDMSSSVHSFSCLHSPRYSRWTLALEALEQPESFFLHRHLSR